jgi:hypothetical protein
MIETGGKDDPNISGRLYLLFGSCLINDVRVVFTSCLAHVLLTMFGSSLPPVWIMSSGGKDEPNIVNKT